MESQQLMYLTMMKQTLTNDPGAKHVVVRRERRRRVERKSQHSKSSISVMFAGSATGEFLPPMVV